MRTKQTTQITVFQTPDKGPKPDIKHQSHLKTTIPSVYQVSPPDDKRASQYGTHYLKMRNYDNFGVSGQIQSQKRGQSKNQWQLKEKVDQYQSQISLLRQYLQSSKCRCLQHGSVSRIFNFPQSEDNLVRQQQRVIKQLGSKVKGLAKQNAQLKSQNVHYSQLKIDQLITQNDKLQSLLQQYRSGSISQERKLNEQNQLLRDELYRQKLQYEQKLKIIQHDYQDKIKQSRTRQIQLMNKLRQLQQTTQQHERLIKMTKTETQLSTLNKIQNISSEHTKQLLQQEIFYKGQLEEQQIYYRQQRLLMEDEVDNLRGQRDKNILLEEEIKRRQDQRKHVMQEMEKMKQFYTNTIQDIDHKHNQRLTQLNKLLQTFQHRLNQTTTSISHLKFQRQNRIQSTIKKSHNISFSSTKPRGEINDQQPIIQQGWQEDVRVNTKPLSYSMNTMENKLAAHQVDILKEKVRFLEKEIQRLEVKVGLGQRMNVQKTEKIIALENEITNLNIMIKSLNYNLQQSQTHPIIKQVIKQVPILPKQYSQQVKNIKDTIVSCNLSNFDTFHHQFTEIIDQRNQLNQRMMTLKKQAKESSKVLVLEKHLKVERERNKLLEDNLKKYEKEIQSLKIQVIQLQGEIQNVKQTSSRIQQLKYPISQQQQSRSFQQLPDGKAGLQWQKVVKHCLTTSINRLQNLQNRMRQDIGQQSNR